MTPFPNYSSSLIPSGMLYKLYVAFAASLEPSVGARKAYERQTRGRRDLSVRPWVANGRPSTLKTLFLRMAGNISKGFAPATDEFLSFALLRCISALCRVVWGSALRLWPGLAPSRPRLALASPSPRLASPGLALLAWPRLPRLAWPCLVSPGLAWPRLASPRLASPGLA